MSFLRSFVLFQIKEENDPFQIPFQYDLYLFLFVDGLYQNRADAGSFGSPDIRKDLVADKQGVCRIRL
jgi:hypothetical protein